jgi:hypothetical protein
MYVGQIFAMGLLKSLAAKSMQSIAFKVNLEYIQVFRNQTRYGNKRSN